MKKGELCVRRSVELLSSLQAGRERCRAIIVQCDKMVSRMVHDLYTCWGAYCDYCTTCTSCLAMCRSATTICWCKDTGYNHQETNNQDTKNQNTNNQETNNQCINNKDTNNQDTNNQDTN